MRTGELPARLSNSVSQFRTPHSALRILNMPLVTLLTDFGTRDSYVGEMKGVLLTLAPCSVLVDISHDIPAGDVLAAGIVLSRVWHRFPAGTVHLAVVDPGVGTARRALAASAGDHCFVAPDNGILSFVDGARFVELGIAATASATFHGRDVFAPAAARLANGSVPASLGPAVADPRRLSLPEPRREGASWVGEVIYVDGFGTLVTNLRQETLGGAGWVRIAGRNAGPLRRTFGDVKRGELVAFPGSGGTIEIAVREGNAARVLNAAVGTAVRAVEPPLPPLAH